MARTQRGWRGCVGMPRRVWKVRGICWGCGTAWRTLRWTIADGADDLTGATKGGGSWTCGRRPRCCRRRMPGIAAQARAQVDWHARHRFCGACGSPTEPLRGGQQRTCRKCGANHFPRTDPVVIVVVTDGERCLLGQSHGRLSSMRMFSALAGFMDQGESIEEAVRREVAEEAGIRVGRGAVPLVAAVAVSVVVDDRLPRRRTDDGPAARRRGDASRALVRPRYGAPRFGRRR